MWPSIWPLDHYGLLMCFFVLYIFFRCILICRAPEDGGQIARSAVAAAYDFCFTMYSTGRPCRGCLVSYRSSSCVCVWDMNPVICRPCRDRPLFGVPSCRWGPTSSAGCSGRAISQLVSSLPVDRPLTMTMERALFGRLPSFLPPPPSLSHSCSHPHKKNHAVRPLWRATVKDGLNEEWCVRARESKRRRTKEARAIICKRCVAALHSRPCGVSCEDGCPLVS